MNPNEKVGPSEKSELSESVRPSKIAQISLAPLPRSVCKPWDVIHS